MNKSKEEILADLRERILAEEYPQGTYLVERELCEHYQISRTPIREILWKLTLDGIVEQRPSHGFYIRTLGWEQIVDIFQAREAIEGMAANLASQRLNPATIEKLVQIRDNLLQLDDDTIAEKGPKWGEKLHSCLVECAANAVLGEIYLKISYMSRMTRNVSRRSTAIERESKDYHLALIDAVLTNDAGKSEQTMREHLQNTCRDIISTFYFHAFPAENVAGKDS